MNMIQFFNKKNCHTLSLLLLQAGSAWCNTANDSDYSAINELDTSVPLNNNGDVLTRSHSNGHVKRSLNGSSTFGSFTIVVDEENNSFKTIASGGKNFNIVSSEANQTDITPVFRTVGLAIEPIPGSGCTPDVDTGPFVVNEMLITTNIEFKCSKPGRLPFITSSLQADGTQAFGVIGLSNTGVVITSINSFIRNVTENGVTVDIIIQLYGRNQFIINQTLLDFLPTVVFNFVAQF